MLTDAACREAKPGSKERKLTDAHGLYLSVLPSGFKGWRFKYRYGGKEKRLVFGAYPLISLKLARAKRDDARRSLAAGIDPAEVKRSAKARAAAGTSFKEIALAWHKQKRSSLVPRYAAEVLRRLQADAFPAIGRVAIGEIDAPKVLALLRKIEARGARTMAHEVRGHLSEIFVWAISAGLAQTDPAATVRKALAPVNAGRRAAVVTIGEARELVQAIDALRRARVLTKLASRLLALTAVRPGVLRLAERSEFSDLDGKEPTWRIPATKMKLSLARKGDSVWDFTVPLSPAAAATARAAAAASRHRTWLFPGPSNTGPISDSTLSQLYLDAGYRGRHVPHGWRASFSTIMNERAAQQDRPGDRAIIDLMLAHQPEGVEAAYNRAAYMQRRRALATEWSELLLEGLPEPDELR